VRRKFDEIVAFAENDKFLDTPVKRYSSGMYVRLAFAVAAHLEPEVLLVDEVLAVGDASFQKKCLGKMGQVARGGRTVLFVSHNMVAVQSLCGNAVWLDRGSLVRQGESGAVTAEYLRSSAGSVSSGQVWENPAIAPGNEQVRLHRVCACPEGNSAPGLITMDSPFRIEVDYWNQVPDARVSVTLLILNEQGVIAFTTGCASNPLLRGRPLEAGLYRSTCRVPANLFNSGRYRVTLLVIKDASAAIYRHDDALSFDVADMTERGAGWLGREPGVLQPLLEWSTERLADKTPAHATGSAPADNVTKAD
jgi:lipopolysaccharide transport system ATP-binding protein